MEKLYQSEKQNRILEICNEVVLRLSDPQYVHSIIFADNNISVFGDHPWGDLVLSSGNLSVCLLMAQWDKFFQIQISMLLLINILLKCKRY